MIKEELVSTNLDQYNPGAIRKKARDVTKNKKAGPCSNSTAHIPWWVYPSHLSIFVTLPIFLACAWMDDSAYLLYQHPRSFLEGTPFYFGLLAILGFAFCSFFAESRQPFAYGPVLVDASAVNSTLTALLWTCLLANAILLFPLLLKPQLIVELASGSRSAMYDIGQSVNKLPGVTSFVSLQALTISIAVSYSVLTGERLSQRFRRILVLVLALGGLRAWLCSERLVLIEQAIPAAVAFTPLLLNRRPQLAKVVALAPVFGLCAVFVLFAAGEYFRSWQFYQHTYSGSYLEFAWIRFVGYYATALNNGAAMYTMHEPLYRPFETLLFLHKSIPVDAWLFDDIDFDLNLFLKAYLNPEFNNTSALYMPLFDFGPILGVLWWMLLGYTSGALFRSFARQRIVGLIIYPFWFIGVAELLRVLYWVEPRFIPMIGIGVLVTVYLKRHEFTP